MKLELDQDEVEAVLLAYAAERFPGAFDRVNIDCTGYASLKGATFSKAPPPDPDTVNALTGA